MNRFYIEKKNVDKQQNVAVITDRDELKHLTKVLRLEVGDHIEVCDGEGTDYLGEIASVGQDEVGLTLLEGLPSREMPVKVDLYQGVPKGQKWDYLLQKSVECGVHSIVPVQMKRSVAKISDEKSSKKQGRWQKIADEAAKQSKRSIKPLVKESVSFSEALTMMGDYDLVLVAYENERLNSLNKISDLVGDASKIAIWIGPEGGIADEEIDRLKEFAQVISLGKRILRTESAAMVLLSQISYIVE
ncbi:MULTISPECIES: 16S rRNA (uracil(1498)-N(3))-methyltransferase [unclassified Fusibacter]|uniref:RsmE family RNA methyltransferase n=1 Tax=unclassified Fusibacter TaxID=2624464 RepID=UPI001010AFEE|nr:MULTISPECIES: RsmE family RNA methyltransferase [unclassified Fusibacter]MCK8058101.1 16S rRNA (uracil(1498)-N(3))-methyltransferase [Fusibacter sp. A2]NPE20683.1 16S rRNA (uracil(1498)-N(3))-methyltransferase [Fusibacter sp. A1]RXV62889.1 16S rRNA (uracil(1498)-N(3))-methyltransferase [Fusibacter sp. A1]